MKQTCEFILSPSELMSGRGVSVTSKLWIRLLVTSGVSVTSKFWIGLLRSQLAVVLHLQEWPEKVNNDRT